MDGSSGNESSSRGTLPYLDLHQETLRPTEGILLTNLFIYSQRISSTVPHRQGSYTVAGCTFHSNINNEVSHTESMCAT